MAEVPVRPVAAAPAQQEWQPIETAPKDGRVILARQGGYAPCHLYWDRGEWHGVEYFYTTRPTHWMPLLQPSQEIAE